MYNFTYEALQFSVYNIDNWECPGDEATTWSDVHLCSSVYTNLLACGTWTARYYGAPMIKPWSHDLHSHDREPAQQQKE